MYTSAWLEALWMLFLLHVENWVENKKQSKLKIKMREKLVSYADVHYVAS